MSKRLFSISNFNLSSSTFSVNNLLSYVPRAIPTKKKSLSKSQSGKRVVLETTDVASVTNEVRQHSHYKRSTHPTSVPISKLFSNTFPLGVAESIEHYKLRNDPLQFQHDLLSTLPFYPNTDHRGRTSKVLKVPIDDKGNYINEFVIYPPGKSEVNLASMKHLVMIHGYGAGLGFYLKNFDTIASRDDWCIHAIDLFGYGCSSRPHFHPQNVEQVEEWFFDSYEAWFSQKNIDKSKVLIMAHSMGAYLMACYGIVRDPNFCKKIIMASPGAIIKHKRQIPVPGYFKRLWERNISPFTLVRKAGPLGSKVVSGWSSRRFAKLPRVEAHLLHKYAYGIFQARGSGEYMLNFLLAPGADARFPLIEKKIHKLRCDMTWWYGDGDWMDKTGGQMCSDIINNLAAATGRSQHSDVKIIENSGHHVYLDNITQFNNSVLEEMDRF